MGRKKGWSIETFSPRACSSQWGTSRQVIGESLIRSPGHRARGNGEEDHDMEQLEEMREQDSEGEQVERGPRESIAEEQKEN